MYNAAGFSGHSNRMARMLGFYYTVISCSSIKPTNSRVTLMAMNVEAKGAYVVINQINCRSSPTHWYLLVIPFEASKLPQVHAEWIR